MTDKPAYRLFDRHGAETHYGTMLDHFSKSSIVLFGELHDNPIVHWLEFEVTKDLFARVGERLVVGAEMFEADDQIIIDEYMSEMIGEATLAEEAKTWHNYQTDYKPILEFAHDHRIPFIATNIPRRYASLVATEGLVALEKLADEAMQWIAPLPIQLDRTSPNYDRLLDIGRAHGMDNENFFAAQSIKDATMAHFILKNLAPEKLFFHLNGEFHTQAYSGIFWYLTQAQPNLAIVTINSAEGETLDFLDEYRDVADYTLVIPQSMTRTG
ncbi:MAG: ChaN family lipoprotein [Acidobacteriota bacterium]